MARGLIRKLNFKSILTCLMVVFSLQAVALPVSAQTSTSGDKNRIDLGGPRKQLATILFAGLGGAVLGLSTLSFYGRPQDKLSNIAIGFAVGVIAGTTYVTYKAATNPSELYGAKPWLEQEQELARAQQMKTETPMSLSYSFEF